MKYKVLNIRFTQSEALGLFYDMQRQKNGWVLAKFQKPGSGKVENVLYQLK